MQCSAQILTPQHYGHFQYKSRNDDGGSGDGDEDEYGTVDSRQNIPYRDHVKHFGPSSNTEEVLITFKELGIYI